jgi:hypothetical protein
LIAWLTITVAAGPSDLIRKGALIGAQGSPRGRNPDGSTLRHRFSALKTTGPTLMLFGPGDESPTTWIRVVQSTTGACCRDRLGAVDGASVRAAATETMAAVAASICVLIVSAIFFD